MVLRSVTNYVLDSVYQLYSGNGNNQILEKYQPYSGSSLSTTFWKKQGFLEGWPDKTNAGFTNYILKMSLFTYSDFYLKFIYLPFFYKFSNWSIRKNNLFRSCLNFDIVLPFLQSSFFILINFNLGRNPILNF